MRLLILLVLLTAACHSKENCEADPGFKKQFDEKIKFIIMTQTEGNRIYKKSDKIMALYYLEGVTGIKSQIYWGDVFGYAGQASFDEDLEKWRTWYDAHKCEMTMAKADSLFKNYKR